MQRKDNKLNIASTTFSVFVAIFIPFIALGQLSKQHYLPPVPQYVYETAHLYISTPYDEVQFTIKPVGQPASSWITSTVSNISSYKIRLDYNQIGANPTEFNSSKTFQNKGYEIVANREIYVSLRLKSTNHAGSLVSKGIDGLGKVFRVGGMERQESNDYSFFSIMATKNNTLVEFTFEPNLKAQNSDGFIPLSIVLQKNETYLALFNGNDNELFIGTLIESNNDIVVNSGSIIGSFSNQIIDSPNFFPGEEDFGYLNGSDMGFDQLVSLDPSVDATEYLLVKGDSFNSIENALIIADLDGTIINLNGDTSSSITLNAGEHVFVEGNKFKNDPDAEIDHLYLQSNKNIYVFQGTGKKGESTGSFGGGQSIHWYGANQGMFFVPPLSCTSLGDVESIARIDEVDDSSIFSGSLFVLSTYGSYVEVNGQDILTYQGVTTEAGPIQTLNAAYQIHRIDNLEQDVSIVGSGELYVSYYNANDAATSGAFYSGFTLEPRIFPELNLSTLGSCVDEAGQSNVTLLLPNADNYDSIKWQKLNNNGEWDYIFPNTSNDNDSYIPNEFGLYRLEVEINCLLPNSLVYSPTINVNICPADFDQDGIVNNVDLDNDNDGILDSVESLGDFEINLTTSPPELVASSSFPYVLPELYQNISQSNGNFTAFTDGRFTSFLPPKQSNSDAVRFELAPVTPKSLNFSFGFYNGQTVPNEENTYYILESVDQSESITLLDPLNEIEVLFDDTFLSGFQQYSSSKIVFKFSESSIGLTSTSFIFLSSQSSGIVFTHHNDSSSDSVFEGKVNIKNLSSFSDDDDFADSFDADSDGDGCSDVVEAGFLDPDSDGKVGTAPLTYDDNTVTNRGLAFHDYAVYPNDNDNNGSYDFQEAGVKAEITNNGNPMSIEVCDGESATFFVDSQTDDAIFQWTVNGAPVFDGSKYSGSNTNSFTVKADYELNGAEISVLVSRPTYVCPETPQNNAILTVYLLPETPEVDPIYTFCFDDFPTILDLKNDIGESVEVFLTETGGNPLQNNEVLIHDQTYFVEAFSENGCISLTRSKTEVFVSSPELISSSSTICYGEEVRISASGVPQTAQDFANANPEFEKFLEYGGSSYFLKRESMAWTNAYNLIQSLGAGASMYIVNSKEEEDAVYDALNSLGVAGTDEIHFWLGLRQLPALNPNNLVDEGWQWLDGRLLTTELSNWSNGEPNDYGPEQTAFDEDGGEDYAQFDFFSIKTWNDMTNDSLNNGDSWPIFEFTGTTEVVWGRVDPNTGTDIVFSGVETSSIVQTLTETTTFFYEVTTNGVVCRVETTVIVNPLPELIPTNNMSLCDDDQDGDSYNGLVSGFDLHAKEQEMLNGDTNQTVLFYLDSGGNSLIDKTKLFSNTSNPQKIYYRVKNNDTKCISEEISSFELEVLSIPPQIDIDPHYECDDQASGSNTDNITTFDLRLNDSRIQSLLGGSAGQFSISYHENISELEDVSNDGIDFYTMQPNDNRQKTIYLRVIDNITSLKCVAGNSSFDLVLTPLPKIEAPELTFEQCDEADGVSDGIVLINLKSFESNISNNYLNESFTYYTDPGFTNESKIDTPSSYYNIDSSGNPIINSTIYVQISSVLPNNIFAPNNSCVSYSEININVAVSQINDGFMLDFNACELPPSESQDGKALFSSQIFEELTSELLNQHPLFDALGVVIRYFPSLDDAARKTNEINQEADYENPNPITNFPNWQDEIWASVEVEGLNTISCIGLKKVSNLFIERIPSANNVAPLRECDDDDDGSYPFDTTNIIQELLLDQTSVSVSFYDSDYNLLFVDNLPNPYNSSNQTIIARVENSVSSNIPSCYDETEISFIVDDTPNFYPIPAMVLCDDSDGIIDRKAVFNTQSIESELLQGQKNVVVNYRDDDGNQLPSPLPDSFTTATTNVNVEILSTINGNCIGTGVVRFEVVENPYFELEEESIFCLNDTTLDLEAKNPSNDYSYSWEYIDGEDNITNVGASQKITISTSGTYRVTATTAGGVGCQSTKTIKVVASELAKISAEDVVISGFSGKENNIEIKTEKLGIGDYEFSVDNNAFQDSPKFDGVAPGMRTISVRDKIGCGVAVIEVGVIGYYKYFSPNNDGINDTWKVLGLNTTFNSLSKVYIYDRYGRFLALISGPDDYWDGAFQGAPLPADDYWFRLELEDGRVYTGNFSLVR